MKRYIPFSITYDNEFSYEEYVVDEQNNIILRNQLGGLGNEEAETTVNFFVFDNPTDYPLQFNFSYYLAFEITPQSFPSYIDIYVDTITINAENAQDWQINYLKLSFDGFFSRTLFTLTENNISFPYTYQPHYQAAIKMGANRLRFVLNVFMHAIYLPNIKGETPQPLPIPEVMIQYYVNAYRV